VQRLNRFYRRSRIAEAKFRLLIQHFAIELHAADAAQLTGISHRSVINDLWQNLSAYRSGSRTSHSEPSIESI
jgi:hypothetical protein